MVAKVSLDKPFLSFLIFILIDLRICFMVCLLGLAKWVLFLISVVLICSVLQPMELKSLKSLKVGRCESLHNLSINFKKSERYKSTIFLLNSLLNLLDGIWPLFTSNLLAIYLSYQMDAVYLEMPNFPARIECFFVPIFSQRLISFLMCLKFSIFSLIISHLLKL